MEQTKKVKVLFLCEGAGFAGAESYACNLIKKIAQFRNHSCLVATCYDGPLRTYLEKAAVKVIVLHGKNNLRSIKSIIRIIKEQKIDLLHNIDLKSTIIGGVASLFLSKLKTVSTIHGLPEPYSNVIKQGKYIISIAIYFLLLRSVINGIICVSNDLKGKMKVILGTKKFKVIRNGIELDLHIDFNEPVLDPVKKFIIGTVGRLDSVKGQIYFLEAAKKIIEARDDIIFQIVGTGPLETLLKNKAKQLGIADHVCFLGFRPDAKCLIAAMDIFVLPSLHEGIPYVLLEAMARSKPVICSNVGGIKEVVQNGSDGILVPPKNPTAISQAIIESMGRKNYLKNMGQRARKKVDENFSSEIMAKSTSDFYLDICNSFTQGQKL